jgi:long-subunit fatty acid transport protein
VNRTTTLFALTLTVLSARAHANGLEPPTSASARYAAIGNASASSVRGPDSLVLNPAGLARSANAQVTLNAMPVFGQSHAPLMGPNTHVRSENMIAPLGELLVAIPLASRLTLGAGFNAAGGLGARWGAVDFGDFAMEPKIEQTLGAVEGAIGLGYELINGLSIGAAWRMTYTRADTKMAAVAPNGALMAISIDAAEGTSFEGFRFGMQYRAPDERWGAGLTVRTPVRWHLTGAGTMEMSAGPMGLPSAPLGDVSTKLVLPLQIALGGDLELMEGLRVFAQYSFTQYSVNESQSLAMQAMTLESRLDWMDRHTANLGFEYRILETWSVSAGYIFESAVIPNDRPSIYTPPGPAHTVGLGTGLYLGEHMRLDAATLYSRQSGSATPAADAQAFAGEYGNDAFIVSGSFAYKF